LSKALDGFLEHCRAHGKAAKTIEGYEGDVRQFVALVTVLKDDMVSAFTEDMVEAYFSACVKKGNIVSTLLTKRSGLTQFAQFCLRKRYVLLNPMANAPRPKLPHRIPNRFTTLERRRLMDLTEKERMVRRRLPDGRRSQDWVREPMTPADILARALLYYTAIRVGTLVRLRLEDIKDGSDGELGYIHTISKGNRDVMLPIVPELAPLLNDYILEHTDMHPGSFLFSGQHGQPWSPTKMQRAVRGWGRVASVQRATPHRFRHTAAMEFLETGATLEETQELLGHANISTTQIYRRVASQQVKNAALRRAQLLRPTPTTTDGPTRL
jgi:site-specific recombinase XerD